MAEEIIIAVNATTIDEAKVHASALGLLYERQFIAADGGTVSVALLGIAHIEEIDFAVENGTALFERYITIALARAILLDATESPLK